MKLDIPKQESYHYSLTEFEDDEIKLIEFRNFFHAKFAGANLYGVDLTAVEIAGDSGDKSQMDILKAIFESAKR